MDPTVTPTAVNQAAFFANIVGNTNQFVWSPAEVVYELRRIIPRTSKWWSDNLYRAFDVTNGGSIVNYQPGGTGTATTSTAYNIVGGVAAQRYIRGWLGDAPRNTDSFLPYQTLTLHGFTRIFNTTTATEIMTLEYDNGNIVNGTYHQHQSTGEVSTDEIYVGGKLHGVFTSYHVPPDDAQAQWVGQYVNGVATGDWIEYDIAGAVVRTVTIVDNVVT